MRPFQRISIAAIFIGCVFLNQSLFSQCDFETNFETGSLVGWTNVLGTNTVSTQQVHTGNYALKMELYANYPTITSIQNNFSFGRYTAWFYVTGPYSGAYFQFHYQDSNNYYQVGMMPQNTDNPKLTLVKRSNGVASYLSNIPPSFGINQWFKMTLERYANGDFKVFINDVLQIVANDTTFMMPSQLKLKGYEFTTYIDDFCYEANPTNSGINLGSDINACEGDTIMIDAGNGYDNYSWNNGLALGATINVVNTGSYFVQANNLWGTVYFDTINVSFNPSPIVDLGNDTTICPADSVYLNSGTSSYNYLWSTGDTLAGIEVAPVSSTMYSIEVENNGCVSTDTVMITIIDTSYVSLIDDTIICDGNSVILYATGTNASYSWSTDQYSDSIIVSQMGMYSVSATNVCGITSSDSVFVQVLPIPLVDLDPVLNFCIGDTTTLDCNVPFSAYQWSTGEITQAIEVFNPGMYFVFVSNVCGTASDYILVNQVSQPFVNLGIDTSICFGDTILLDAQNTGFDFTWSTGDTTQIISLQPSYSSTYIVTVSNFGCNNSDTLLVDVFPYPLVDLGADTIICVKDTILLDAGNSGASFIWSNSETNQDIEIYPISPEIVWVDVSSNGCHTIDSVFIDIFPDAIANLGNDTLLCEGGNIVLGSNIIGSDFLWSTGDTTQQIIVSTSGVYMLEVSNQCEDTDEDTIVVSLMPLPSIYLGNDTIVNYGDTLELDAGSGFVSYLWNNSFTGQFALFDSSLLSPGTNFISVLVSDSNMCYNSDTLMVNYQSVQNILLQQGWNIISTYMDPFNPNIEIVLNSLLPNLEIAKNGSGDIYWPLYQLNFIGNMQIGEGYYIKMINPQILQVQGTILTPELTPITIDQGWSIIGYLRQTPAPINTLLSAIESNITIVKNSNGYVYWPTYGFNSIGDMNPGEGYQRKMTLSTILLYPAN